MSVLRLGYDYDFDVAVKEIEGILQEKYDTEIEV